MSALPYHKRFHSDALAGFMSLTLEERGAYQTLLDLMYDRGGPIVDNERLLAGYMGVSLRKWKSVREILIEKGKIYVTGDGLLSNFRVEKEHENGAKTARKHAENGLKGGRKSVEVRKNLNKNNETDQARLKPGSSLYYIPDTRYQKEEEKPPVSPFENSGADDPPKPKSQKPKYALQAITIRLNASDLENWRKRYHAIPDLDAELWSLDGWLQNPEIADSKRNNWFQTVSGCLNRKHQEILALRQGDKSDGSLTDLILAKAKRTSHSANA